MRTVRIGQILSLGAIALVLVVSACAQEPTQAPAPIQGSPLDPLVWVKEIGFPISAFLLLFGFVRTTMRDTLKSIDANTQAVNDMKVAFTALKTHCERRMRVR